MVLYGTCITGVRILTLTPSLPHPPIQGALTQAIVATKEQLEGEQSKATPSSHVGAISETQRKKEREMVMKEVSACAMCVGGWEVGNMQ